MSHYLPPMKGGQDHSHIRPGPIKSGQVPTPTEIMVIQVPKVFDFCFQEDILERCFVVPEIGLESRIMACDIVEVTCAEIGEREPLRDQEGLALVSIQVTLTLAITIVPTPGATPVVVNRVVVFPKQVVLCAPIGTDVTCEVRGTCICTVQPTTGAVNESNLCCTIQLCIVIKSTADVNILVPTFGIVLPQECRVAPAFGGCPPIPPNVCPPLLGTTIR